MKDTWFAKLLALPILIASILGAPLFATAPARAQDVPVEPMASPAQGPTNPAELEAFLDGLLAKEMEEYHVAGAAVSVVKDGELFLGKGYGYADVDNKIPVDPEQTLFGIGSITKTFTWTAVMQLAEQGKLDLDADINAYLDFRIPDTYPQPITLRHLMTHTSGFEDRLFGSLASDAGQVVPARDWLISHMSARVRPPGMWAAYANYNAMLAGYIVGRVSGQPYDGYIQEHILDPLGMVHSTAQAVVPPELQPQVSVGYTYQDGTFRAFPEYFLQPAGLPSGGVRSSAADMARFMIANLQKGRYSDAAIPEVRIFTEATAQQILGTMYTPDPRLGGTTYGFFDFTDNGQRTLGNIGYVPPMHSLLIILPDQDLGVFVTYNSEGGSDLVNQHLGFQREFFDHYYPAALAAPTTPPADFSTRSERFVGIYGTTQGSQTTLEKVGGLFGGTQIRDTGDGALTFDAPYGQWRFIEVAPLYFRSADNQFGLVFREDDQGNVTHMATDLTPQTAYKRLSWYQTPGFSMALAASCILLLLSAIPVASIRAIRNRRARAGRKPQPGAASAALWLIVSIGILDLVVVVGTMQWAVPVSILHPVALIARVVLGLGVVSTVLTAGALIYSALAWNKSYWGIAGRLYYMLLMVAALAFVWFLNYWNLLGWRY